jgi:hypothetical protein
VTAGRRATRARAVSLPLAFALAILALVALGWTLRRNLQLHILGRNLDALGLSVGALAAILGAASVALVVRRMRE